MKQLVVNKKQEQTTLISPITPNPRNSNSFKRGKIDDKTTITNNQISMCIMKQPRDVLESPTEKSLLDLRNQFIKNNSNMLI